MQKETSAMNVLVIGKSPAVLEKVIAGLRAQGIVAHGTTEVEHASVHFDARDFALVAFGGGVETPIREQLKREFTQQNPDVILLDTFAAIAVRHIAATLRDTREFASRCEVTAHERSYLVRLDVMQDCQVHVEVYHLRDTLEAETIVQQHISPGPTEVRIDESQIHRGLNMILVTLGERELYVHRIEQT
jgi:hypothetical protein